MLDGGSLTLSGKIAIPPLSWIWRAIRWPFVALRNRIVEGRVTGKKLTVVVCALENDPRRMHAKRVASSLQEQFGDGIAIHAVAKSFSVEALGDQERNETDAANKARILLRRKKGDVLVYGAVIADNRNLDLRFVAAEKRDGETAAHSYALNDKLLLPEDFGTQLAPVLAAAVATAAAPAFDQGNYVVPLLRPVVGRLEALVAAPPAVMQGAAKGLVFHSYATAMAVIGEQAGDRGALHKAVSAFKAALLEWTRETVPLQWAATQNNLGAALRSLGARESGTETLEQAVAAFKAALEVYTRETVPLDWATTQNNLGAALAALGARESGTETLKDAVEAYRAALEVRTRERVPLDWAGTQNNLGAALAALGARESGTETLEQAVKAYRAALEVRTRERVPLDWAMTQNNLGAALRSLGERESGTETLEQAVAAYRAALEVLKRETVPLQWAMTQNNLGNALQSLGERESGTETLKQAVAAFIAALEVFTPQAASYYHDGTARNLARAVALLAQRRGKGM